MESLLEKTREITAILKQIEEGRNDDLPYTRIAQHLSHIIGCNSCIVDSMGDVLGYSLKYKIFNDRVEEFFTQKQFPTSYIQAASRVYETKANLSTESPLTAIPDEWHSLYPDSRTTIAPIHVAGIRFGTLIIWRNETSFNDDDLILVEIAATVVGIQLLHYQRDADEKRTRDQSAVQMALGTLSFSEMKAVSAILAELSGMEGNITASSIAGDIAITRSVIVNAIRKLESAGILESRSLGMKGTYIKILNSAIFDELHRRSYV